MAVQQPPTQEPPQQFSNTCVVRDNDGKFSVFVGNEKMLGIGTITSQPQADGVGMWCIVIPSSRVRIAERVPAQPVYEDSNVVVFPNMRAATAETTQPPTSA